MKLAMDTKRARLLASLAIAAIGTLTLVGAWFNQKRHAEQSAAAIKVQCVDLTQLCRIRVGGETLTLRADQPPSALKPFKLEVTGLNQPIEVRFGMAGMEMGPIAFPLRPEQGRATLTATLPLCVQGRRDWLLWLDRPEGRIEVTFVAQG